MRVTVQAGEEWDTVVAAAVADGLTGIECLSGIPGSTGATPIQNVGAYGQEVAETITAAGIPMIGGTATSMTRATSRIAQPREFRSWKTNSS
jgi:UDP-N-acetylmuramate dehydrogenase